MSSIPVDRIQLIFKLEFIEEEQVKLICYSYAFKRIYWIFLISESSFVFFCFQLTNCYCCSLILFGQLIFDLYCGYWL